MRLTGANASGALSNVSASAAHIVVAGFSTATAALSNVAAEGGAGVVVRLINRTNGSVWTQARCEATFMQAAASPCTFTGGGFLGTAQDTDAVQIFVEGGGSFTVDWSVYGYA